MIINVKSIFTSGFVAGIVILIIGAGLIPIIGDQMDNALKELSLPPLSNGAMIYFAINSLILGIGVIGFYALLQCVIKSYIKAIRRIFNVYIAFLV